MNTIETEVREAAKRFREAVERARGAGYVVTWPPSADGLDTIAINETARVKPVVAQPGAGTPVTAVPAAEVRKKGASAS